MCECSICENHEYDMKNRMTLKEMIEFIGDRKEMLDSRHSFLTFYNYCPFCGKKINWKDIKNKLK